MYINSVFLKSFFVLVILSGCAGNSSQTYVCPVQEETANPNVQFQKCNDVKASHLSIDEICMIQLPAIEKETTINLVVQENEEYLVSAPKDNNWWCDATRPNFSLCGENGSALMNFFAYKKRVENSQWFSVIAEVITDDKGQRRSQYDLCNTPKFIVSTTGKLVMYPNDADGFFFDNDIFYENNTGKLWLKIQRVK